MSLFAPIVHEDDKFSKLNSWLKEQTDVSAIFILVDENTHEHCLPLLLSSVEPLQKVEILEIPAGEENKTLEIVAQLWASLTELKADRKSLLINLGGGVITDLGGFAASCFKRGIRFINIPTTLLAMVDAAHGGKTGIDFEGFKNQVGLFSAAEITFIYPGFCSTLDHRQFISGYAECVKHALIYDRDLWQALLINGYPDAELAGNFIEPSLEIKKKIVEEDPKEKGLRKILNFGHTVGHAIESLSLSQDKDPLLHGEAIAMGMIAEMYIATHTSNMSQAHLLIASKYISEVFPLRMVDQKQFNTILSLMQQDKKNYGSEILCSLISSPGEAVYDVAASELLVFEALEYLNQTTRKNQPTPES
ncbi:MAG: 3-dehydroquinate synthase [Bacteroidota bacterium]